MLGTRSKRVSGCAGAPLGRSRSIYASWLYFLGWRRSLASPPGCDRFDCAITGWDYRRRRRWPGTAARQKSPYRIFLDDSRYYSYLANLALVKDVSRRPRADGASAVPAGGGSSPSLPGGSGIMPAGTMTGMRGASLQPGRRRRGWPELSRWDDDSLRQEPWWNAGRCARDVSRAPQRKLRRMVLSVFRRSASFFLFVGRVERSETHRTAVVGYAASRLTHPTLLRAGHDRDESRPHRRPSLTKIMPEEVFCEWRWHNSGARTGVARTSSLVSLLPARGEKEHVAPR